MIVKRLPTVEVIEQPVSDVGVSCDCVDPVFNAPNPDCKYCNGTGIIQASLPPEKVQKKHGNKKVWLADATIIKNEAGAIYDEEELVITDIHAFFHRNEDIQVGDLIIPESSKEVFVVRGVQKVRNTENIILTDCAIEIFNAS